MKENPDITNIAQPEYEGVKIDGQIPMDHAGKWETSIFWYLYPQLTYIDKFKFKSINMKLYKNQVCDFFKTDEEWLWDEDLRITASPQLGKKCVDEIVDNIIQQIKKVLKV